MTDKEIIEALDAENRNLRADLNDAEDEISNLTRCLSEIDNIAQNMAKSTDRLVKWYAADIRLYSDEEQRQDGV